MDSGFQVIMNRCTIGLRNQAPPPEFSNIGRRRMKSQCPCVNGSGKMLRSRLNWSAQEEMNL